MNRVALQVPADFFSWSSLVISSATLKPTTRRSLPRLLGITLRHSPSLSDDTGKYAEIGK
jgi:hypothetical protein